MPLLTDPTSIAYNSHFDIAAFDAEMTRVGWKVDTSLWTAMTDPMKEAAILDAVANTKQQKWNGAVSTIVIAPQMIWPRSGLTYPSGSAVSDQSNPDELLAYEACWILSVLALGGTSGTVITTGEVKKRVVGKLTEEYTTSADSTGGTAAREGATCESLVSGWMQAATSFGGIATIGLTRT